MGIIGKIVGGTLGFAFGGPLGAVAGAVFGHAFDSDEPSAVQGPHGRLSHIEESQLAFFVGTFSMLAKLVKADGRVTREEMAVVEQFAYQDLGLTPQSRDVAFNIFNAALDSPATFEDFAAQFIGHFRGQNNMVEMMVDILLRVSAADGSIHVSEEALILSAVRIFNFNPSRYEQLKSKYVENIHQGYDVLGANPADTDEAIKKRYRYLVKTYHPDKIAGKGLPDEFTQLAQDKFREIQAAYESIKQERGIR